MEKIITSITSALYPNPVMLVSASHEEKESIITLAWGGTMCSNPPIVGISIRKNRFSYNLIEKSKEFVINIPTSEMLDYVELCGTKSGLDTNKWGECNFTKMRSQEVKTPFIKECPVSIECKLNQIIELGTHDLFLGEVVAVHINEEWKNKKYPNMVTYTRGVYKKCVDPS